ncbi:hypothetical protein [Dokdonella sp.]|uniref:hypothetical protein n=1 Tax=Dokdonella sp. TaxID=2291710 RepID=UPI002F429020
MKRFVCQAVAVLIAGAATAALAQDAATLEVQRGVVMTSRGGEFATAHSGQSLRAGERVMVTKDGAATIVFGNCRRTYDRPGVYTVGEGCDALAAGTTAGAGGFGGAGTGGTAAFVAATAVAAGVIAHNINTDAEPEAPISR